MTKTVVGLFGSYDEAQAVVRDLREGGFAAGDISIVANRKPAEGSEVEEVETLGSGVGTGAAIGGIAGLILGLGALVIPGIGPIIAAGPIAAALTGAGIGAAAGGLLGTLSHMGVPEDEANFYAEGIRHGGALVAVHAHDNQVQSALDILNGHGAVDVDERDDDSDPVLDSDGIVTPVSGDVATDPANRVRVYDRPSRYEDVEPEFRTHFQANYPDPVQRYEDYEPAYRLGHRYASLPEYKDRNFEALEADLRSEYEGTRGAHPWMAVREAVHHAFQRIRGQRA